ncbi:MAG: hydroxymethylglutaryl-CoA reductase, degradative [Anaerolineae bacterium]|nr:hydroxymethylglutaryl-CoA reductase, degradative [Anaerolineae bacterium]MDW8101790.1 hydroxymethylglutaryl-CoA reductase, degradative [Anaerolineae bacterium]
MEKTSRLPGFYRLSLQERIEIIAHWANLSPEEKALLEKSLSLEQAEKMIENVIGLFPLPLGVAVNFLINGKDYLIPMAIEEPSVVAGLSHAAKLVREGGGFQAESSEPLMIAQIQVMDIVDMEEATQKILEARDEIFQLADAKHPTIVSLGGGSKGLEIRKFPDTPAGPMLVIHLLYDTRDAMGANVVNTVAETIAPFIEEITGGRVILRILSNLSDRRLARARCLIPWKALESKGLPGKEVARRIVEAWALAAVDPYRAATHNKGIMNGIDAVAIATGNDWRALEAGAHAYAVRNGQYGPLTTWKQNEEGDLEGFIELPIAVGTVGGATRVHPVAKLCLKILGVETAKELAQVMASVGLGQNLAALLALATEGIQRGHMKLHARQVAIAAGATGELIDLVAKKMVEEGVISPRRASEILQQLKRG